ncbi:hypothetical protein ACGFNU_47885 [Spirillospora sp. NPDC048911]
MSIWITIRPEEQLVHHGHEITDLIIEDLDHAAPLSAAYTYCG